MMWGGGGLTIDAHLPRKTRVGLIKHAADEGGGNLEK